MLSSKDKSTNTEFSDQQKVQSDTQILCKQGIEREQVFQLIENFLSFEACLYHQVVPLKMEDNSLLLGMVNQEDNAALDYVHRILSYINCTLVLKNITGDIHRKILSSYLNYKNTSHSATQEQPEQQSTSTPQPPTNSNLTQTENTLLELDSLPNPQANSMSHPVVVTNPHTTEAKQTEQGNYHVVTTGNLPILSVPTAEEFSPVETLLTLPPKKLLEELLGRVLAGGIGRLYLERLPYTGRILWSENGVLQSVLEKVPLSVFQGVMNELKRFGSLPVITLAEPKQVERECLYQQDRLLLRLRVMPGMYGEEATLQVLRGAALKFYQQQQLTRLSRDALSISQQLSYKLHELQERILVSRNVNSSQIESFNALNNLLQNLDQHIKKLTIENSEPPTK
ncbi:MAG: pilus assembly protein PilB [Pelatocladus maniniholoensis HA4357-MV3]|uniref:Pilus assembly protein PilB n=1 Tax=Pelatocladus maniniholoensis HA4357-MV3 TaxID=1117104 RepID=A0A9E3HBA5_9NOST|nr:pilus assembly protein PilB [Pelatocladus maniniholoensis HA4357-MV3]